MSRASCLVSFALIGAVLAACGGDSNGLAPGFECLGQALPTTAPPLVNVSGMVTANVLSPSPVPHAFVYGFRTGDTTHLAGDTTNTPGQYSLPIPTGGTPVTGYLAISDSGHHIDTYAYPAVPLAADVTENVLMVSRSEFSFLAAAAGITPVAGDGFRDIRAGMTVSARRTFVSIWIARMSSAVTFPGSWPRSWMIRAA